MNKLFKSLWNDNVIGKIIADFIKWIIGLIFIGLLSLSPRIYSTYEKLKNDLDSITLSNIGWIFLFLILFTLFIISIVIYIKKISLKRRKAKQLKKYSGDKITITELKEKFPDVERISIVGKGFVGKTTLIEHICKKDTQNVLTQGRNAYIHNFSSKEDKYAALLDASGQSQSTQNDIALEATILVVLLDHNRTKTLVEVERKRIDEHKRFLSSLNDRLISREYFPKWIHILLNKEDLWGKLPETDKTELETEFLDMVNTFKTNLNKSRVTHGVFSNENQSASNINKLANKICKELI